MALVLDRIALPLRAFDVGLTLEVERDRRARRPVGGRQDDGAARGRRAGHGPSRGGSRSAARPGSTTAGGDLEPDRARAGLVFQDYALFPHLSVRANVEYGGKARAGELLERFGIAHLADDAAGRLSGGERQRVAVARALARDPAVLLLDEPLSALDAHTKASVRAELHDLLAGARHSRPARHPRLRGRGGARRARSASSSTASCASSGTATELVAEPADAFVASFTGANLLHGHAEPTARRPRVRLADGGAIVTTDPAQRRGRRRRLPVGHHGRRDGAGGLGAERHRSADPQRDRARQPRADHDRAGHRRGDRGVAQAARARAGAARRSRRSRPPARGSCSPG